MTGAHILIVDDETQLLRTLVRSLSGHGYQVRGAEDGASALGETAAFRPDVILLDLMLPDTSGIEVCRKVRETQETPIIVLSAVGEERAKIEALDAGADDYLTKPFGMGELLARVRVALRRGASSRQQSPVVRCGGLEVDLERRRVEVDGEVVHLSPTEYALLKHFAVNAGKVLTHPMIMRAVWGDAFGGDTHVLRTTVNQLRKKLHDDAAMPRFIRTDPGVGYRFEEPEADL